MSCLRNVIALFALALVLCYGVSNVQSAVNTPYSTFKANNFPSCKLGVNENLMMCVQERDDVITTCVLGFWLMTPLEIGKCCNVVNGVAKILNCNKVVASPVVANPIGLVSDYDCLDDKKRCGFEGYISYHCVNKAIVASTLPKGVCCNVVNGVYSESAENCALVAESRNSIVGAPLENIREEDFFKIPTPPIPVQMPCNTTVDTCSEDGRVLYTCSNHAWAQKMSSTNALAACCAAGVVPSAQENCVARDYCSVNGADKCSSDKSEILTCLENKWARLDTLYAPNCCSSVNNVSEISSLCLDRYCPQNGAQQCSMDEKVIERCDSHMWMEITLRNDPSMCCTQLSEVPTMELCE